MNNSNPSTAENAASSSTLEPAPFLFAICQNGSEAAARKEVTDNHPELRLAFSRPGFITFKVDPETNVPLRFNLKSTMVRTYGWSLGKAKNEDGVEIAKQVASTFATLFPYVPTSDDEEACRDIHVWQRDPAKPGKRGFEPGVSPLAAEVGKLIVEQINIARGEQGDAAEGKIFLNRVARPEAIVFDVVLVEPDEWWFGFHLATSTPGRWPGGVPTFDFNEERIARAYYKLKEALLWSGISIEPGETCAEVGSAPGGACELLLELGANVIGVDPAEMEDEILAHQRFVHLRKRGHEVRKREFKSVDWLVADISMPPAYTLDTVRDIVSHESVNVKGVILTIKLSELKMLEELPVWLKRIKKMGFQLVKSRQLAFNRGEICLVGVRDKFLLRSRSRKRKG